MDGLTHIRKFWRDYYETMASWSNEALETDSKNADNHQCRPIDPKQQPLGPLPQKEEEKLGLVLLYLSWCELGTASMVSNDNGAG